MSVKVTPYEYNLGFQRSTKMILLISFKSHFTLQQIFLALFSFSFDDHVLKVSTHDVLRSTQLSDWENEGRKEWGRGGRKHWCSFLLETILSRERNRNKSRLALACALLPIFMSGSVVESCVFARRELCFTSNTFSTIPNEKLQLSWTENVLVVCTHARTHVCAISFSVSSSSSSSDSTNNNKSLQQNEPDFDWPEMHNTLFDGIWDAPKTKK